MSTRAVLAPRPPQAPMTYDPAHDPAHVPLRIDPHGPTGMPVAAPTRALARAIEAARASRQANENFRQAICGYVAELKAAGVPPEKVLVTVKHHLGPHTSVWVVEQASKWCLAAYYDMKD